MYLGKRIKELRIKKGLTQLELANSLFVDDRTISKWEQERGNPSVNIIPSLAEILGVSIDYLFNGKEYTPTQDETKTRAIEYFESLIEQEITNDYTRRLITRQIEERDLESVKNALDTCFEVYLSKLDKPYKTDDIRNAVSKIGGIIHNQSLSPLDKKIKHLVSYLSKNTVKPSTILKKHCEKAIKAYLETIDSTNTCENRIKILDKVHIYCVNKHYDLDDAIRILENFTRKEIKQRELKKRIESGFLQQTIETVETLKQSIFVINKCIKENNLNDLPKAVLDYIDVTFRFLACKIDKELDEGDVPFVLTYYQDLYVVFGRFLGKSNYRTIKYIIEKYSKEEIVEIVFNDLLSMNNVVNEMLYKLEKHNKSAINNFKYSYFKKAF